MKSIENNSGQLAAHGYLSHMDGMGLCFILVGIAIFCFEARPLQIYCERILSGAQPGQIACTMSEKLLGFIPLGQRMALGIQRATIGQERDAEGEDVYRVEFATVDGPVPVRFSYTASYEENADIAEQINHFIGHERQNSLDISIGIDWLVLFVVLFLFVATGIGMILWGKQRP